MPKPYPKEFRDDVVRVARQRGPGVTLESVAEDFGIHAMTLSKWMRQAWIAPSLIAVASNGLVGGRFAR